MPGASFHHFLDSQLAWDLRVQLLTMVIRMWETTVASGTHRAVEVDLLLPSTHPQASALEGSVRADGR